MTAPILPVLESLPKARRVTAGGGWIATCPVHDDSTPSLTWAIGEEGRALLKCHAGCATEDVVTALGLTMKDLFESNGSTRQASPASKPQIVATYDYRDRDGNLAYQVMRYAPKSFRQRRRDGTGGWVWSLEGVDRLLYHRAPE